MVNCSVIGVYYKTVCGGSVLGSHVLSPLVGLLFVLRAVSAVRLLCELEAVSII